MGQANDLIEALKRELRARRITYAGLGQGLGLAESSVKRMFAQKNLSLRRLEAICEFADIDVGGLLRSRSNEDRLLLRLTEEQEREIASKPKLFLVAVCLMNLVTYEEILGAYQLSAAELVQAMTRLDRIGFIRLLPNNRYKLLLARTFAWIPNGPMQNLFKANVTNYFDSDFSGDNEMLVLVNARLSRGHVAALVERLRRVARDVSEEHQSDASMPLNERGPVSLLIALRPWQLDFMNAMSRPAQTAAPKKSIRRKV